MQPTLDNSDFRIKRAKEQVRTLRRMQQRLTINPDGVSVEPHTQPVGFTRMPDGRFETVLSADNLTAVLGMMFGTPKLVIPPPVPLKPTWAVRFGETIYNLRTALDYLVYALAYLDSGEEQEGTQFPICDTPKQFEVLMKGRRNPLVGLHDWHVAAVEALQPYPHAEGIDRLWLARLRDFSNPDKHRHPTLVVTSTQTVTRWQVGAAVAPVQMDFAASRFVSLGDAEQTPLIPTLDSLLAHVAETLDQFRPEFQGQGGAFASPGQDRTSSGDLSSDGIVTA